ncbi:MAG: hypothetical protein Q8M76_19365 [Spirochaetaceae bacterium]|nr:hypothetical protein [Spirochaetaceae bacterium]
MRSFQDDMNEFHEHLKKGAIQRAYRGLMEYFLTLKAHFLEKHPDWDVAGNVYYGFMDMTYFGIFPKEMKDRRLKIAVVFLYEEYRFDVWLSGSNRQVQEKFWRKITEANWNKYYVVPAIKGSDSIVEYTIERDPDFTDLDGLTRRIEKGVSTFVEGIGELLEMLKA